MPTYDYYCPNCDHEQEEFHSMSDEPKVHCAQCDTLMKKAIKLGHGGYKMISGSTRRRDYRDRYGAKSKKSSHNPDVHESADLKAKAQREERIKNKKDPNDPYAEFRD